MATPSHSSRGHPACPPGPPGILLGLQRLWQPCLLLLLLRAAKRSGRAIGPNCNVAINVAARMSSPAWRRRQKNRTLIMIHSAMLA